MIVFVGSARTKSSAFFEHLNRIFYHAQFSLANFQYLFSYFLVFSHITQEEFVALAWFHPQKIKTFYFKLMVYEQHHCLINH